MEETPENDKESLHSAHANGMNESLLTFRRLMSTIVDVPHC